MWKPLLLYLELSQYLHPIIYLSGHRLGHCEFLFKLHVAASLSKNSYSFSRGVKPLEILSWNRLNEDPDAEHNPNK
jgi:hypothetical protein